MNPLLLKVIATLVGLAIMLIYTAMAYDSWFIKKSWLAIIFMVAVVEAWISMAAAWIKIK